MGEGGGGRGGDWEKGRRGDWEKGRWGEGGGLVSIKKTKFKKKLRVLESFRESLKVELHRILGFWSERMVDLENGGFYGRIDGYDCLHSRAGKGVILNARILWAFSAASRRPDYRFYRGVAERAFAYFRDHFADPVYGGVFWMLDFEGEAEEMKKQIYAQAFAVYALSEYYLLTKDAGALEWATGIYGLIERHSRDREGGGYLEAFSRRWELLEDLRLSAKDANEKKTMNTHLHVLEAYTNLYRAWPDEGLQGDLQGLIELFLEKFIDPQRRHLHLFFDEGWNLKSDLLSFGHDIEASWLLTEAAEALGDALLLGKVKEEAVRIAEVTLREGVDTDGGLFNEAGPGGLKDSDKIWWPQAEAMVGFYNAYQLSGDDRFQRAAWRSWEFIRRFLVDEENGEWRWSVDRQGKPLRKEDKAGPWKAPYHNGRACLEMLKRLEN